MRGLKLTEILGIITAAFSIFGAIAYFIDLKRLVSKFLYRRSVEIRLEWPFNGNTGNEDLEINITNIGTFDLILGDYKLYRRPRKILRAIFGSREKEKHLDGSIHAKNNIIDSLILDGVINRKSVLISDGFDPYECRAMRLIKIAPSETIRIIDEMPFNNSNDSIFSIRFYFLGKHGHIEQKVFE